jgi:hypothetical protein
MVAPMGMWDRMFAPITAPYTPSPHRPTDISGLWWQQPQTALTQIVIDDIFGDMPELVDRGNAMKVPAVTRARDLLVGGIADLPLVAYRGDTRLEVQPPWTYRTDVVTPWHRMAFTIDDLYFYDASLWLRQNDADGFLLNAARVPIETWAVDPDGRILIDDKPVDAEDVIYFPGPTGGGLLANGRDTIRGARNIDRAWQARTRSPIPPTLFQQTQEETASREDIDKLLSSWAKARINPDTAGVGFVPWGLTPVFPAPADDSAMFISARNAVRLDVANLSNIPASLLDGSTATASLTYTTVNGQKSSFHEQSLRYWMAPLEHRLSMDDVVPRGQRVRFDITYETQVPPYGETGED